MKTHLHFPKRRSSHTLPLLKRALLSNKTGFLVLFLFWAVTAHAQTYVLQETGQTTAYDEYGNIIAVSEGETYYGQDAHYEGTPQSFQDNGDGTVSDLNTGLMWQQTPPSDGYGKDDANTYCENLELAGYDDWRLPTIKELFAIGNYSEGWPYLDETYFDIAGNTVSKDEQFWAQENYVGVSVESGSNGAWGVNHGTGHIKTYPSGVGPGGGKRVRAVRGNITAVNDFVDNSDGTVTDNATGLMWSQADNGEGILWVDALEYAEESELAGYDDWRLPNIKELQSIVDYSYSPTATDPDAVGPANNPIFSCSSIINEAGNDDYPYFWSSTSARFSATGDFYYAWYVAFGMAVNGAGEDYHGAGAVRFDTKALDGPAGEDATRSYNYVRLVRNLISSQDDTLHFAQFAEGQGILATSMYLINQDATDTATVTINLRDDDGNPVSVDINGTEIEGEAKFSIPPMGTKVVSTDGYGDIASGSATVTSTKDIDGVLLYGGTLGVAGVSNCEPLSDGLLIPLDSDVSAGISAGIAVMNPGNDETTLDLELLDNEGNTLAYAEETLPGLGHLALYAEEFNWDTTVDFSDFIGLLKVTTDSGSVAATGLRIESGAMATLPVVPYGTSSQDTLYFSHFAEGQGILATSLYLINQDETDTATVTINLRDDDGNPVSVDLNGTDMEGEAEISIPPMGTAVVSTDGYGDVVSGSATVTSTNDIAGVLLYGGTLDWPESVTVSPCQMVS